MESQDASTQDKDTTQSANAHEQSPPLLLLCVEMDLRTAQGQGQHQRDQHNDASPSSYQENGIKKTFSDDRDHTLFPLFPRRKTRHYPQLMGKHPSDMIWQIDAIFQVWVSSVMVAR